MLCDESDVQLRFCGAASGTPSNVVPSTDVDQGPAAIVLNARMRMEYFENFLNPVIIDFVVAQP